MFGNLLNRLKLNTIASDVDFWNVLQAALATLFLTMVFAYVVLALQACDPAPCGVYGYPACENSNVVLMPVPIPLPAPATDGGKPTTMPPDSAVCAPEETPPTCTETCLTPFGKCVSACVKTHGANKYGGCVRKCRKENV